MINQKIYNPTIIKIVVTGCFVSAFFTGVYFLATHLDKEENMKQYFETGNTAPVDGTKYTIGNADTVIVHDGAGKLSFNYAAEIIHYSPNNHGAGRTWTFSEYGNKTYIFNVKAQGCLAAAAIERETDMFFSDDDKEETTIAFLIQSLNHFRQNHCQTKIPPPTI